MMTTLFVLRETAKVIAPFAPFIAEHAHKQLGDKPLSVHMKDWPKADKKMIDKKLEANMLAVKDVVEVINSMRQESKIKLRWPLARMAVSDRKLKSIEGVIKLMCNVKRVDYGEVVKVMTLLQGAGAESVGLLTEPEGKKR